MATLKTAAWETSHVLILKNRIKKTCSKEETLQNYLEYACFYCHPLTRYQRQKLTLGERTKRRMPGGEGEKNISPHPPLPSPPYPCFFSFDLRPGIVCPHACTKACVAVGIVMLGYFLGAGAATRSERRSRETAKTITALAHLSRHLRTA